MRINNQDLSKEQNFLAQILSDVLFNLDPARTCCKENDMIEEYDKLSAWVIFESTDVNVSLEQALIDNFACFFSYLDRKMINTIIENYNEKVS